MGERSKRNFRSHYYEKMGFRGVEEKKSLDILLRENPMDRDKIHNFCLRFPLPSIYRVQVWQLLLGVLPVHDANTNFVWGQRVEQFRESARALGVTRRISPATPSSIKITVVWLLEANRLQLDLSSQLKESSCQNFTTMVQSLEQLVSSEEEVYWISSGLASVLRTGLKDTRSMYECLANLLGEDASLLSHLETIGAVRCAGYGALWERAFAGVFQPSLLARLWDKVIGGSIKILVYVLASSLFRCKQWVMKTNTEVEVLEIICRMEADRQDVVLTQAYDLWVMDGCPLAAGGSSITDAANNYASHTKCAKNNHKSSLESRMSTEINIG